MHKIIGVLAVMLCIAGCTSTGKAVPAGDTKGKEPAWVSTPRSVYAENQYVAAVGYGADRESAEKNAIAALVGVFGQAIKGETTVSSHYTESVQKGSVVTGENSSIDRDVKTSVDLETVVGAEIKDIWFDGKNTTYAVAVMDKMKATPLYSGLLDANEEKITNLIAIPDAEKNTLDAYARYDLAAKTGDKNGRLLNVLSVLSPAAASSKRSSIRTGDQFKLEVLRIAQNIPISVKVANDRDGRIKAALSSVITASGFKTGGAGSRYVLDTTVTLSEVVLANQTNKFVRYLVDARLTDTTLETVLLPFTLSGREGHGTAIEAENRALRVAEQKIKEEYAKAFSSYLVQLSSE